MSAKNLVESPGIREQINKIKEGFRLEDFDSLQRKIDVPAQELASILRITNSTLHRRKKTNRFNTDESDKIFRIRRLFDLAVEVFENQIDAKKWFKTPQQALDNKTPFEFSDTQLGAEEVRNLLLRIEHGVFS